MSNYIELVAADFYNIPIVLFLLFRTCFTYDKQLYIYLKYHYKFFNIAKYPKPFYLNANLYLVVLIGHSKTRESNVSKFYLSPVHL